MKVSKLIYLILIITVISSTLTYLFYQNIYIENIVEYDVSVKVADKIGVNVDGGKLFFGKLFPYSYSEKHLTLNNNLSYPVRVVFISSGETKDWLTFGNNNFIMYPGQDDSISVTAFAPTSDFGNYTGSVKIIFKKVFFYKRPINK